MPCVYNGIFHWKCQVFFRELSVMLFVECSKQISITEEGFFPLPPALQTLTHVADYTSPTFANSFSTTFTEVKRGQWSPEADDSPAL